MHMLSYKLNHIRQLESESIFVLRETAAQFDRPALLFSGGKDSIVMAHLARKAFHPARIPFMLLHVDTGHNFPETIEFRDRFVKEIGASLVVAYVQDSMPSRHTSSTPHSAAVDETRKRLAPRSGSSHTATTSGSGIPRDNAPNCGTCSTDAITMGNISASSL